jgi:mono/diheme cytochrome c family protein
VSAVRRALIVLTLLATTTPALGAEPDAAAVQALLQARCVLCHSGPAAPLGLRLDSHAGILAGSSNGPVVLSGKAGESELIRRVRGERQPRMPMTGPPWLTDAEVVLLESWINAGLPSAVAASPNSRADDKPDAATAAAPTPAATPRPDGIAAASTTTGTASSAQRSPPTVTEGASAPSIKSDAPDFSPVAVILAQRCAKCHTDQGLMGAAPEGLRLTSHREAVASNERARVVPGNPDASELVRRIRGQSLPRMPFDGPPWLSASEIAQIERWIAAGARDGAGHATELPVGARVRLGGRLSASAELDGLPLRVDAETRRDKSPQTGDRVEVRGHVDVDGGVRVERLRRR